MTYLENLIHKLGFLQKAISYYQTHYRICNLLHIVLEIHIALIQYINNSNKQLQIPIHSYQNTHNIYPLLQNIPYLLLELLIDFLGYFDRDRNNGNIGFILSENIKKVIQIINKPLQRLSPPDSIDIKTIKIE